MELIWTTVITTYNIIKAKNIMVGGWGRAKNTWGTVFIAVPFCVCCISVFTWTCIFYIASNFDDDLPILYFMVSHKMGCWGLRPF